MGKAMKDMKGVIEDVEERQCERHWMTPKATRADEAIEVWQCWIRGGKTTWGTRPHQDIGEDNGNIGETVGNVSNHMLTTREMGRDVKKNGGDVGGDTKRYWRALERW